MEAKYSSFISIFLVYIFISISVSISDNTLSVIHIDSLDRNTSRSDLLERRLQRDVHRVQSILNKANLGTQSSDESIEIPLSTGEYLVQLGVGSPAQMLYMAIDTASDISWINCSDPFFDPTTSSSFSKVECASEVCKNIFYEPRCDGQDNKACPFEITYGDKSSVSGEVLNETLLVGETEITNFSLGCSHDSQDMSGGFDGILGLGRGSPSFPMQTANLYGKKFSYCLNDLIAGQQSNSSSIIFGSSALSENASYTPMLESPQDLFYHVSMTGISVGGDIISGINSTVLGMDSSGDGGVFVDSGTTATWLTTPAYKPLKVAFLNAFNRTGRIFSFSVFDTCYDIDITKDHVMVPHVVLHFEGGADMDFGPNSVMINTVNSTYCFAFVDSESKTSIIGNIHQQGFRVSFDPDAKQVGFTPHAC